MTYALGPNSIANLTGVHPDMVRVVRRAIQITPIDFKVTCGVRTKAQQQALYAQGRTRPGKIVTWTLNSRHLPDADGWGRAVDLLPAPYDWRIDDDKLTPEVDDNFAKVAQAMLKAAAIEGVRIRWGADWNMNGKIRERKESDNPHFELAR